VDVIEVRSSASLREHGDQSAEWGPHPPASANGAGQSARAALA